MDTRKLIAHIDGESGDEGRIEQDGYGILCSMTGAGGIDILPEIVKRWNAYPELVEALQEAKGTLAAIAEMSQRHDPETGFLRDLSPYDTYRSLLPCFQRINALLATLKTN